MNEDYRDHLARQGFEIKEKIGSGLSGGTYKGFQSSLNRPVAIKFFDNKFAMNDESLKKRFLRESRILAELQHPSTPYVITSGTVKSSDMEIPYMVMQYISGINLDAYIKKNPSCDLKSVLHIAFQLLDALDFVHSNGIVHRDLKPSNIMLLTSGHCYIIDFSIGSKIDRESRTDRPTQTGDHLGSPPYMSPEQMSDMKSVNGSSDLYSLTMVLCELLTGKPDVGEIQSMKQSFSSAIKKVLTKGAAFSPEDRYPCAADYLRELKQASTSVSQFVETPSKAVCVSTTCPDANWSSRGYYRGPTFLDKSTNTYCTSCGHTLLYRCPGCSQPIENTRFCGGCGTEQFVVPECKMCGSYLKKEDMGNDTSKDGCDKCRRRSEQANTDPFEDDIPF